MAEEKAAFKQGLEDVVAGESSITEVNGAEGRLIHRGYDIHDLATNATFEEVIYLLWNDDLPGRGALEELRSQLNSARPLPAQAIALMKTFPKSAPAMDALRTSVSALSMYDPDNADNSLESNRRKAVRLTAQMCTLVAAWHRIAQGQEPIAPAADLDTAANFLYQLSGERPSETAAKALDVALTLHADHELNASTFAARVTVATLTDMYSAITSAVGTLAGPLHGGANVEVKHMLERIGSVENAETYVQDALGSGKKIMGIGHRVYRTTDPRATSLAAMSERLADSTGDRKWFDISRAVEQAADRALASKGKTTLKPNVDFFSASVYTVLGIPTELFTPVFAISRVSGWTAHVLEQLANNRLIRPRAIYTGPRDRLVEPIARRS